MNVGTKTETLKFVLLSGTEIHGHFFYILTYISASPYSPWIPDQTGNNSSISTVQNTSSIAYFGQRTKSIATYTPGELNY